MALINDTQVVGHDAAGNQLGDGIRTYLWDADHRLLGIYYDAEPNRSAVDTVIQVKPNVWMNRKVWQILRRQKRRMHD